MKSTVLFAVLALASLSAAAEDAPPPPAPAPGPQGVFVTYARLGQFAETLGDVPMKYAAPILQNLQKMIDESRPPAPPVPAKKPKE